MPAKKKMSEKVDKRHRSRVLVGADMFGQPIYKYVSSKTKAGLELEKIDVKQRFRNGLIDAGQITFGNYAKKWMSVYVEPNVTPATLDMYVNALRKHIYPVLETRFITTIMPIELQGILSSKAKTHSSSLISQVKLTLSRIFAQATADYILDRNPALGLKLPSVNIKKKQSRRALTELETQAALIVADTNQYGMIIYLLYYLGVRRGEALGLQWLDIDWQARTIHVQRDIDCHDSNQEGELKSAASNRFIPIPDPLYEKLKSSRSVGAAYIVPTTPRGPLAHRIYQIKWDSIMSDLAAAALKKAKEDQPDINMPPIECDHKGRSFLTAHYFRHNYATLLHAASIPVTQAMVWLGHSDIKTTLGIYTHLEKNKMAEHKRNLVSFFQKLPNGCQIIEY